MLAGATDEGICLLEFVDRRMLETQIKRLKKYLNAEFVPGTNKHFDVLAKQLKEYFEKKRKHFDVPLQIPGTEFQGKVWNELMKIPFGSTRSYRHSLAVYRAGSLAPDQPAHVRGRPAGSSACGLDPSGSRP